MPGPFLPKVEKKFLKYDSAPSGYVFIGKYQPPFITVPDGHGYLGVVMLDKEADRIQCHQCGEWYQNLAAHVSFKHDLLANQYKEKFGLLPGTALVNEKMRNQRSDTMTQVREDNPQSTRRSFEQGNKDSGNRKGWKKPLELKNKYGVCYDQLLFKIKTASDKLGRTPALRELKDEYGGSIMTLVYTTFGSYTNALHILKLTPLASADNPAYNRSALIQILRDFKETNGREPKCTDEKRGFFPSFGTFKRYFKGGIKEAKKIAYESRTKV